MTAAQRLTALLSQHAVHGISIGNPSDKSTWRLDFEPDATDADRAAAQAAVAGFDYAAVDGVMAQITALEAQQTDRRVREAIAGTDGGWMSNLNQQITALRAQLPG
jgi:hypothetical protein